ncbi:MAG: hypothetical protein KDC05_08290, partial [Bacteroidales bacterium]|nr:hypothetical protein [Bacteroidales bacterium]
NFNLNTDLSIRYEKNDWYLESGIGLGITHNNGIFDVNYAQYDSIGYYYKVDQVTINETTGKPVLHTVTENVYDTLFYNQNINTRNSYTYLRIPLYAGIEVQSYRRLSVYLRAGITYNILISSNEKQAEFENSNATWIEINDQTPQRIQSNFALSGGLGFNYRLSRNVLLVAEPTGSYWAKPVYQRTYSVKSPWALGLRTGIIFKFGKP